MMKLGHLIQLSILLLQMMKHSDISLLATPKIMPVCQTQKQKDATSQRAVLLSKEVSQMEQHGTQSQEECKILTIFHPTILKSPLSWVVTNFRSIYVETGMGR